MARARGELDVRGWQLKREKTGVGAQVSGRVQVKVDPGFSGVNNLRQAVRLRGGVK